MTRNVIGILAQAINELNLKAPAYIFCSIGAANQSGTLSHLRIVEKTLTDGSIVTDLEVL